jgi:hypothetical protein
VQVFIQTLQVVRYKEQAAAVEVLILVGRLEVAVQAAAVQAVQ